MKRPIAISASLFALCLLTMLASFGCSKDPATTINTSPVTPPPVTPVPTDTTAAAYTFLALGDSYTIGQGVSDLARFPTQTVGLLQQQNINISNPVYIARTGWTSQNLIAAINSANPPNTFDVVTLLIGVNDQYQHQDTGSYRIRFTELLNKAVVFAKNQPSHVFVLSIPDYSATPFVAAAYKAEVSKEIDWFNAINKQVTLANNITYIDITPSTRLAATDPTLIASDSLHPSGKEYNKWADMLTPKVKAVLQ